jgi:hypothetical protein
MTSDEINLIRDLRKRKITSDEFLRRFRSGQSSGGSMASCLLQEAYSAKDSEAVEYALLAGFTLGFGPKSFRTFCQLLEEDWHMSHEDLVSLVGEFRDPSTVDLLLAMTSKTYKYLEYDEARALAVKAIWALGSIPGDSADRALHDIAKSDNPILRENALHQLDRRKSSNSPPKSTR